MSQGRSFTKKSISHARLQTRSVTVNLRDVPRCPFSDADAAWQPPALHEQL